MIVKQVTVRVENREGKLKEVMDLLGRENINVEALSMADTVTRLILPEPEQVAAWIEPKAASESASVRALAASILLPTSAWCFALLPEGQEGPFGARITEISAGSFSAVEVGESFRPVPLA